MLFNLLYAGIDTLNDNDRLELLYDILLANEPGS